MSGSGQPSTQTGRARIGVYRHPVSCIIGAHAYERTRLQTLFIDVEVVCDASRCARTDSLSDVVVDYTRLASFCAGVAERGRFHLLEAFAHTALEGLLREFPVSYAKIVVRKPLAHEAARYAKVTLWRYAN